ncbi:MAG: hypothetical protein GKR90_17820 [Pseudomonadales bacterium]|nr:hypothetical protein [Pseudomonadales bacterium]
MDRPTWHRKLNRKMLFRVFAYALFLLFAPFAVELVIMADIVGVEAAIAFLFVYGRSITYMARDRVVITYNLAREILAAHPKSELFNNKVYAFGSIASLVLFWVTGSVFVAACGWLPSLYFMGQV